MHLHLTTHFVGHFAPVILVPLGQDELLEAGAGGGENLLLNPADAKDASAQLISPVMARSERTRRLVREARATAMVEPALGPSLGVAPAEREYRSFLLKSGTSRCNCRAWLRR